MSHIPAPPQRDAVPKLSELPSRVGKCSICGHLYPIHAKSDEPGAVIRALEAISMAGCPHCSASGRYQLLTQDPVDLFAFQVRKVLRK